MRAFLNLTIAKLSAALQVATAAMEPMRKPRTIGELSLSPSSRRGAAYTVISGGAPTPYTIEKHALWCLFVDGQALPDPRDWRMRLRQRSAIWDFEHVAMSEVVSLPPSHPACEDPINPLPQPEDRRRRLAAPAPACNRTLLVLRTTTKEGCRRCSANAFAGDSWSIVEALLPPQGADDGHRWRLLFEAAVRAGRPHAAVSEGLHTVWVERGHRIREQIADDALVLDALWVLLPRYSGGSLRLFRGENLARWRSSEIGFAWTEKEEVARMFGRGLNALFGGGVLLYADVPAEAIIVGPNHHSTYLGEDEYIIDRRLVADIECRETFPDLSPADG